MNSVERVKIICKQRHLPLSKLEKDLGYANGYISQLKKGTFPADRLYQIAKYLNVSTDYLATGETVAEVSELNELHENLKILRKSTNLTEKEFAKKADISESRYISFETGNLKPSLFELKNISSTYSVPSDILCGISILDYPTRAQIKGILEDNANYHELLKQTGKTYIVKILKILYGNVETVSSSESSSASPRSYIIGTGNDKFTLSEEDIVALYNSVTAFLPAIIDRLKQPLDS